MRFLVSLVLLLGVVAVCGCGGQVVIEETTTDTATSTIKAELTKIAESGDAEAVSELRSYIEEDLAGVDQAKSDALMPEYEALQALTDPEEIKAAAKEMLGKL